MIRRPPRSTRVRSSAASDVYKRQITARYGTPFTPLNHYSPWNVDDEGRPYRSDPDQWEPIRLEVEDLVNGVCNQERFLQIQRDFVAFDQGADGYAKRVAKPHQY